MSTTTTPNMGLVLPVPISELGPAWAIELNSALGIVDSHNHSTGQGVQITPAGLNISSDLSFNTNNAISLRSSRFASNGSPLSNGSGDTLCAYVSGVDLYYNDGTNQIRITQGGSVSGSTGTITGLPSGTASASFQSGSGTFEFQQATSTAGNIDAGTIAIRYPGSYPTLSGNAIQLRAPLSLASAYSITLPALPGANNSFMLLSTAGVISTLASIGQSNVSLRTTGSSASIGNVLKTASSGSFITSSTSFVSTGCTGNITILGNPVQINIQSDGTTNVASMGINISNSTQQLTIGLFRDGSLIGLWANEMNGITGTFVFPLSLCYLDTSANNGTHTYDLKIKSDNGGTVFFLNGVLTAYETK